LKQINGNPENFRQTPMAESTSNLYYMFRAERWFDDTNQIVRQLARELIPSGPTAPGRVAFVQSET
jgi:hypothetical protein